MSHWSCTGRNLTGPMMFLSSTHATPFASAGLALDSALTCFIWRFTSLHCSHSSNRSTMILSSARTPIEPRAMLQAYFGLFVEKMQPLAFGILPTRLPCIRDFRAGYPNPPNSQRLQGRLPARIRQQLRSKTSDPVRRRAWCSAAQKRRSDCPNR